MNYLTRRIRISNKGLTMHIAICMLLLFPMLLSATVHEGKVKKEEDPFNIATDKGELAWEQQDLTLAMKYFIEAQNEAKRTGDSSKECLAAYNIGACYFQLCEYGEAQKNFQEAYEICLNNNLAVSRQVEILNGLTGVLFMNGNYSKAFTIAQKGFEKSKETNDTEMCMAFAIGLAQISNKTQQFSESEKFLNIASHYGKNIPASMSRILTAKAEALYMQQRYDELEEIAPTILHDSLATDSDKGTLLAFLINIWNDKHDYDKSLSVEKNAIKLSALHNMPFLCLSLSKTYEKTGNYKKALSLRDSTILYKDSLATLYNREQMENANVKIEVMRFQMEKNYEMAAMKQHVRIWEFIVLVCILLLIMAAMIVYTQKQRNKHRHEIMEMQVENERREKKLAEEKMKETELAASYRQQLMKKEMEKRNVELSATAMFVTSRNKLIQDLLKHLSDIQETRDIPAVNNLYKHLDKLLREDTDQDTFMVNFEAANPEFSKKLLDRHPDLIQSDLRFLAYVRMNMSMKEISAMLNIAPDSCKRRKIRLSQKLGLESSADLYSYILSL